MKLDPYKNKEAFEDWKINSQSGIEGISKENSNWIIRYVSDMEIGQNIAKGTKKGARGYPQLNKLRTRLIFLSKIFEKKGIKDITKLTEKNIFSLFDDMTKGKLTKINGETYKSVSDYVKVFKAFWHWYMKISRKEDKQIQDITLDLSSEEEENGFVHFTKEDLEKMMPYFSQDEQVRMLFMFDTIIRSPTELMNVKVSDLTPDYSELAIREETSKTYGRTIKLLLCSKELRNYVERNKLGSNDYLFKFSAPLFNQKLKKIAKELFGDRMSKGGSRYSELTMYDFRHSGTCHWRLGAYQSKIDALMYRGGWSSLEMLNYYTKKIGMKDSIEKEDLLIGIDKTALEKEIENLKREQEVLKIAIQNLSAKPQTFYDGNQMINTSISGLAWNDGRNFIPFEYEKPKKKV
jgi:integrase